MKPIASLFLHLLHCVLAVFICTSPTLHAGSPPDHSWNPNRATNPPYGLVDLDLLNVGDYGYCRWGVLMSSGCATGLPWDVLGFTPLTSFQSNPIYGTGGSLFLDLCGTNSIVPIEDTSSVGQLDVPNRTITILGGTHYSLFRKYHFPLSLPSVSGETMNGNTRKAIVLIHGWNPDSDNDPYDEPTGDKEFYELRENLKIVTVNSDWQVFTYHWEKDADTGPKISVVAAVNGSEAAEAGHLHGQHLGELIDRLTDQKIEKVHFIAHSAGSWTARAATKYLFRARANTVGAAPVKIQITMLDPFVPGDLSLSDGLNNSELKRGLMNSIIDSVMFLGSAGNLYRLENYYSVDPALGTNRAFAWRGLLADQNGLVVGVGIDPLGNVGNTPYGSHSGPVLFYSDSVSPDADGVSRIVLTETLFNTSFDNEGWNRSLFYNEPIVNPFLPTDVTVLANGGKTLTGGAHLRGDSFTTSGITYRWEWTATPQAESSWTVWQGMAFGSAPGLTLSSAQVNELSRSFRLVAATGAGYDTGDPIPVGPTVTPGGTVPDPPTNLTATAVSSSQINLNWHDASNNENGFKLQRRLTSGGGWTDLPNPLANTTAFANITGLSPDTSYTYHVRAFNSSGDSAWSSEQPARTLLAPTTNITLSVYAVDTTTSPLVPLNVTIATWTGVSDNYASLLASGNNGFTRTLPAGAKGWFSAPATLPDGRTFRSWLFGPVAQQGFTYIATYNLTANTTAFANYAFGAAPTRTLSSLAVEGPSSVDENSSATYKARATFTDGTSAYVIPQEWRQNSSYADISAAGVLDAESVSSDKSVTITATYTSGGVTKSDTKTITIRDSTAIATYTLTRNVVGGGEIGYSPHASNYAAGTVVSLHANEGDGYVFSHWTGDASGTEDDITIRMDGNRSVTAHFVVDITIGNIRVNISPPQAVTEGAQWKYHTFTAWRDSGNTQDGLSPRTDKNVYFKDIPGWMTPDNAKASIIGGQTTVVSGAAATYHEILGAVQVTLSPDQAGVAGARWRLDGGSWTESGVTLANASTGTHTIEFVTIPGWTTPPNRTVSVVRGVTTTSSGAYGPPVGFPIITAVSPRTGPISGGTVVTIEGANFQAGATVSFGGVAAMSVTVVSPTRITAVTPPHASYGSVALALTSGGQTVTQGNGFSYLNTLGANIELVGQIGGNVEAVAVVGNTVYYGEGAGLVVSDFTNPASPVERGRIALPAFVKDVVVVNNIAFVAAGAAGLYAVDVSTPTAPSIVGFFDTDDYATGVAVYGGVAYVADFFTLQILDVTNPAAIVRAGLFDTAGIAQRVSVGTLGSKRCAFVAERDFAMQVIDVTTPITPVELSNVPAQTAAGITDVKLVGTKLYFSDWQGVVKIFDASNPSALVQTGSRDNIGAGAFIDVVGNRLYTCAGGLQVADLTVTPNPAILGYFDVGSCYKLVVANGLAFAAMGGDGLKVVAVSNPASMSLRSAILTLGGIENVWVSAGVTFVGNSSGLHTVDVSNPARPVRLATLPGARVTHIVVADGKATLVNYGNPAVRIANVANPSAPSLLGTYTNVEAWNVALMGNTPVLAAATRDAAHQPKLDILNISAPSSPQSAGSVLLDSANGIASAVTVVGSWAFVGRQGWAGNPDSGLDVVSLANPASPQKVGSVSMPNPGFFGDVAASEDGNFVYVGDWSLGIQVVDVTVKTAPVLGQLIDPPQTPGTAVNSVQVVGNRLFADQSGFIFVFDISNPASPQIIGYYNLFSSVNGIAVADDLIFVGSSNAGLSILRLNDVDKPTVAITLPTTNTAFPTTSALISLGGTATDLQGVVRVTWENDRGGGGVAQTSNSWIGWTVPNIQLAAGANVISVTAEDAQGNLARDSITVTATLPDSIGPSLLVTGPKPPPAFTFTVDTLPLTGTAADVSGVQSVTWANDRGGSGTATGTMAWSADIPLVPGPNGITITARDTAGNTSQTALVVTYLAPDAVAPIVQIAFPVAAQEFATSEEILNLAGTADDAGGLARVRWSNSRGGQGDATGTDSWQANGLLLQPGQNILTVTAEDLAGNTATDTLAVMFTPGDSDQDGLLDAWEILYFGTLTQSGSDDSDSDGQNNVTEQATGTNPTSGASHFAASTALDGAGRITLTWPSLPGRGYEIEITANLTEPWTTAATVSGAAAPAVTTSWIEPPTTVPAVRRFYRVRPE